MDVVRIPGCEGLIFGWRTHERSLLTLIETMCSRWIVGSIPVQIIRPTESDSLLLVHPCRLCIQPNVMVPIDNHFGMSMIVVARICIRHRTIMESFRESIVVDGSNDVGIATDNERSFVFRRNAGLYMPFP
jgi:hypothetical protein